MFVVGGGEREREKETKRGVYFQKKNADDDKY
jgi:hypothetical protein